MPFIELSATSNFTFLTGASHPEDYVLRAAELGFDAIAIADVNSVAGIVRAHTKARELARDGGPKLRLIPAARIVVEGGFSVTALTQDRAGWGRLCRLLTLGRRCAPKGQCHLTLQDLLDWGEGLALLIHPQTVTQAPPVQAPTVQGGAGAWLTVAHRLTRRFGGDCYLLMAPGYDGQDRARFAALTQLAAQLRIPTLASALPLMHHGARRKLADVLTAIRLGKRIDALGLDAAPHGENRLRSTAEMLRLFRGYEGAVHRAGTLAATLTFSLDELRYEYPSEIAAGETPATRLARLAEAG